MISYTESIRSSKLFLDIYEANAYNTGIVIKEAAPPDFMVTVKENYEDPTSNAIYEYIDFEDPEKPFRLHLSIENIPITNGCIKGFEQCRDIIRKFEQLFNLENCGITYNCTNDSGAIKCNAFFPYRITRNNMYALCNIFLIKYQEARYINILQCSTKGYFRMPRLIDSINYPAIQEKEKKNIERYISRTTIQNVENLPIFMDPLLEMDFWEDSAYISNCHYYSNILNRKLLANKYISKCKSRFSNKCAAAYPENDISETEIDQSEINAIKQKMDYIKRMFESMHTRTGENDYSDITSDHSEIESRPGMSLDTPLNGICSCTDKACIDNSCNIDDENIKIIQRVINSENVSDKNTDDHNSDEVNNSDKINNSDEIDDVNKYSTSISTSSDDITENTEYDDLVSIIKMQKATTKKQNSTIVKLTRVIYCFAFISLMLMLKKAL